MALNKPSGLSLEQFKKIFANEPKDTKNVFKNNAQYFYYAEKQYNVNGVFLAAVAIHESGWGGSNSKQTRGNKNVISYFHLIIVSIWSRSNCYHFIDRRFGYFTSYFFF